MSKQLFNKFTITIFLCLILSSFIGRILGVNSQTDNTEYRRLLTKPVLKDAPLSAFPKNFTEYFNDDFGLRNIFIKMYGDIKLNIFNTHPLYSNLLGKKGWVFMNPVVFPSVDGWHLHADFTDDELNHIAKYLQAENDWLKKQGALYIVVIVPYKEDVYPENYPYPNYIVTKPLLDHFIAHMQRATDLNILDLRQSLMQAKLIYPVYYHTDSHWNQWGAYVGYQQISNVASIHIPGFHLYTSSEFDITPQYYQRWVGDLMRTSATWKEQVPDVGVKLRPKPNVFGKYSKLDQIYVYGDSFAQTQHFADRKDFLEHFPELKNKLNLIFASPTDSSQLRIKLPIDQLIPVIENSFSDKKLAKRLERYLVNFRLQDDELLGLNYFLQLNFEQIHFRQRQEPLEKELIARDHPQLVIREIIEQTLYSTFDELQANR